MTAAPPAAQAPPGLVRTAVAHLRLYESVQVLVPGLVGILSQQSLPDPGLLLLYGVSYGSHVLSVYSFNDYCDYEADALNPRKASLGARSITWLRNQTLVLTATFLVSMAFLPVRVRLLFLLSQIICMGYSHPRLRLKRRLLGSEFAHFVAGFSYFTSGVLLAGGRPRDHWLGGLLFGLLYLSGGTFNEIMDFHADRAANLRHLVVLAGRRHSLTLVFAIHYCGFALLALYEPSALVASSCIVMALLYTVAARHLARGIDDPQRLLRFRRHYRILFAALLAMLSATRTFHVVLGRDRPGG